MTKIFVVTLTVQVDEHEEGELVTLDQVKEQVKEEVESEIYKVTVTHVEGFEL